MKSPVKNELNGSEPAPRVISVEVIISSKWVMDTEEGLAEVHTEEGHLKLQFLNNKCHNIGATGKLE